MAAGPDIPIPSIEDDAPSGPSSPSASAAENRSLSPSVVLTRPSTDSFSPDVELPSRSSLGVEGQLENVRLTTEGRLFDMAGLSATVDNVEAGGDSASPRLDPDSPSPGTGRGARKRARRRRSGSQTHRTPHDVRDEEMPPERFHEPTFQQAFTDAKRMVGRLAEVLSGSSLINEPDSTLQGLREKALQLSTFRPPSTRTIGFVGDSGVGKRAISKLQAVGELMMDRQEQPPELAS